MNYDLLTRKQVEQKVQLTTSSIYRLMREGLFPTPLKIGPSAVRWRSDELKAWIDARPRAEGEVRYNLSDIDSAGALQATA